MNILKHWYWEQNPDVAKMGFPPIKHWIKYGRKEGRNLLPPFWYIRVIKSMNRITYFKYLNAEEQNNFHMSLNSWTRIRITRTNFYQIKTFLKLYFNELMKTRTLNILFEEGKVLKLKKTGNKLIIKLPEKSSMREFEIELLNHLMNMEKKISLRFESDNVYDKFIKIMHQDIIKEHKISTLAMTKDVR
jgi:hypothetical protein